MSEAGTSAAMLMAALRARVGEPLPLPGAGSTADRHAQLFALGREDLSLARLAEAHWDAVAILNEAGRRAEKGAVYAVWASEKPGAALALTKVGDSYLIAGTKQFLSGAGLVDRALVTVAAPTPLSGSLLFDVDVRANAAAIEYDGSSWQTDAFLATQTASGVFRAVRVSAGDQVGGSDWYVTRAGFWHGACGPAACWAGGAAGLLDYAMRQSRHDPHTLAHLGAMHADVWALCAYLESAGREIDRETRERSKADSSARDPFVPDVSVPEHSPVELLRGGGGKKDAGAASDQATDRVAALAQPRARIRARTVRHLVEQACTDILRRLPRAYGPLPLAMDRETTRRYQELDLYLRQCHAERDLEALGQDLR